MNEGKRHILIEKPPETVRFEPEFRPLPRGKCPACGTDVALRKGDLVREHRPPARLQHKLGAGACSGSGKPAAT